MLRLDWEHRSSPLPRDSLPQCNGVQLLASRNWQAQAGVVFPGLSASASLLSEEARCLMFYRVSPGGAELCIEESRQLCAGREWLGVAKAH